MMPKIALVGYGSMGKEIEKLALNNGFVITDIFDEFKPINPKQNYDFDVAIDFTTPASIIDNINILSELGKNIVIGTTGWYDKLEYVENLTNEKQIGIIWGANFSIGMQMFYKIVSTAAKLVNLNNEYDIFAHELHHKRKKDSPSGTAIALANIILENVQTKESLLTETSHNEIATDSLHFTSTRGGEIPGTHTIYIDSLADTIEITHRVRNRTGLANGALKAAEMIYNRKGFFQFNDLLEELWISKSI